VAKKVAMLHSKFVAINQEAQSVLHAALGSGIQGSLIEVSYVILKQLQCCHCMQVFPRLLELGPGQFKAALHRLMMPLPSLGDPSCHVEISVCLYCMLVHFHPAAVCHNTSPAVCKYQIVTTIRCPKKQSENMCNAIKLEYFVVKAQ